MANPMQIPKGAFILKIQQLVLANKEKSKLLIYSTDNSIPPITVPNAGTYKEALGDRMKAYFVCTKEGDTIHIGKEVYMKE